MSLHTKVEQQHSDWSGWSLLHLRKSMNGLVQSALLVNLQLDLSWQTYVAKMREAGQDVGSFTVCKGKKCTSLALL